MSNCTKMLMIGALLWFLTPVFAADNYKIDQSHSNVQFSIKHMVLSTTRGNFGKYSGNIKWDPSGNGSEISGVVTVDSIDTRDSKRDEHLRSADFFDSAKFPEMSFVSKSIKKARSGYLMTGIFSLRGISKEVAIPLTVAGPVKDPWGNQRMNFNAQFKINRQVYGMNWNKVLDNGGLTVGNDVTIELDIEAIKVD